MIGRDIKDIGEGLSWVCHGSSSMSSMRALLLLRDLVDLWVRFDLCVGLLRYDFFVNFDAFFMDSLRMLTMFMAMASWISSCITSPSMFLY